VFLGTDPARDVSGCDASRLDVRTGADRGASTDRSAKALAMRFLALTAAVQLTIIGLGHLPALWFGAHAKEWPSASVIAPTRRVRVSDNIDLVPNVVAKKRHRAAVLHRHSV
jgi:hypothetical protein